MLQVDPHTSSRLPPDEVEDARDGLLSSSPPDPPLELLVLKSLLSRTFREPPFFDFPRDFLPPTSPSRTTRGEADLPAPPEATPSLGVAARLCGCERDWC